MNSSKSIGGGVLIAVRRGLLARTLSYEAWQFVEQLWVEIKLVSFSLYLCAVYFPPDGARDRLSSTIHPKYLESLHRYG